MKPGDLLVFYTDGIVEAEGRDDQGHPRGEYGVDRLLDVARSHQGERAKAVVEAIFKSVEEFTHGAPPEDDRTVMVVSHPVYDPASTQTLVLPRLR
jgi:sigma-B regulation protein RsbU (phosphoserine phosphatase)